MQSLTNRAMQTILNNSSQIKSGTEIIITAKAQWSAPPKIEFNKILPVILPIQELRILNLGESNKPSVNSCGLGDIEFHNPKMQIIGSRLAFHGNITWICDAFDLVNSILIESYLTDSGWFQTGLGTLTLTNDRGSVDTESILDIDWQSLLVDIDLAIVTDGILKDKELDIPLVKYLKRQNYHQQNYSAKYGKTTRTLTDRLRWFGRLEQYTGMADNAVCPIQDMEWFTWNAMRSHQVIPEWDRWLQICEGS